GGLRRDVDPVALAAQDGPDGRLRVPTAVAVRSVEVVDASIERVPDEVSLTGPQPARAEGDVGHPHAGAAERRVAPYPRPGSSPRLGRRPERKHAHSDAGEHPALQELTAAEPVVVILFLHGS